MHVDTYVYISPKVNVHVFIIENLSNSKPVHPLPFWTTVAMRVFFPPLFISQWK